jgi:hypothetical protein
MMEAAAAAARSGFPDTDIADPHDPVAFVVIDEFERGPAVAGRRTDFDLSPG